MGLWLNKKENANMLILSRNMFGFFALNNSVYWVKQSQESRQSFWSNNNNLISRMDSRLLRSLQAIIDYSACLFHSSFFPLFLFLLCLLFPLLHPLVEWPKLPMTHWSLVLWTWQHRLKTKKSNPLLSSFLSLLLQTAELTGFFEMKMQKY